MVARDVPGTGLGGLKLLLAGNTSLGFGYNFNLVAAAAAPFARARAGRPARRARRRRRRRALPRPTSPQGQHPGADHQADRG